MFSVLRIAVKISLSLNASCSLDIRIHTETLQLGVGAGKPGTATASPAARRSPPPNCASEIHVPPVSWPSWPFPEVSLAIVPAAFVQRPVRNEAVGENPGREPHRVQPSLAAADDRPHQGRGKQGRPASSRRHLQRQRQHQGRIADRGCTCVSEAHDGMRRRHQGVELRHQGGA